MNTTQPQKPWRRATDHLNPLTVGTGSLVIVLLIVVGSLIYQNHQAQTQLTAARIKMFRGNYPAAKPLLGKAARQFSLGTTKRHVRAVQAQNQRWLNDAAALHQAEALFHQGNLTDAKQVLQGIDKTFPKYHTASQLLAVIKTRETAARQAAKAIPSSSAASQLCYAVGSSGQRTSTDLPDDITGYQLHIIYALPSDGADHQYDTNGSIATSVSAWQNWLCNQTGGRTMRLDTHGGVIDVSFVRFTSSDDDIKTGRGLPYATNPANNPYVREDIQSRLQQLGFTDPHKLYAVYYDGTSNYGCGGGALPPQIVGHVAATYLHGGQPGWPVPCEANHLATDAANPGYLDFTSLHETLHTLGLAASCAPHHLAGGYVSDSPTDLLYFGSQAWNPSVLDLNHDDYYGAGIPGCLDLSTSAFLTGDGTQLPPNW